MDKTAITKKRIEFFHLILVNLVGAAQLALAPALLAHLNNSAGNLMLKIFLAAFILPSFLILLIKDLSENNGSEKITRHGLFFIFLGNILSLVLLYLNLNSFFHDIVILGCLLSSFGLGVIIINQMLVAKNNLSRYFIIIFSVVLGFLGGPVVLSYIAGPNFDEIKTVFLLSFLVSGLGILEFSQAYLRFELGLKRIMGKVAHQKQRFAIIGLGIIVNNIIIDYLFDFVLYPIVIWKTGIVEGGIIMMVLSAMACYLTMLFYNWTKKDWLGLETIKSVRDSDSSTKLGRMSAWLMKKSDPVVLIFLSINFDPFITTVYMRKGSHNYNAMGRRDWTIFLSSLFIANAYWTIISFTGVSFLEWIWKLLS